jgi:hypothetical protein
MPWTASRSYSRAGKAGKDGGEDGCGWLGMDEIVKNTVDAVKT